MRQAEQLPAFPFRHGNRRLADHMNPLVQGKPDLLRVHGGMRRDVNRVHLLQQLAVILRADAQRIVIHQIPAIRRADSDNINPVDIGAFLAEFSHKMGFPHKAEAQIPLSRTDLRGGNPLRAGQIDHTAVIVEIVELSYPIRTDGENIHLIFPDIINLLSFVLLHNHHIGDAERFYRFHPLDQRLLNVDLPARFIKVIRSNPDYKVIAQRFRALQKPYVTVMQQVKCPVSDYFYHTVLRFQRMPFARISRNAVIS